MVDEEKFNIFLKDDESLKLVKDISTRCDLVPDDKNENVYNIYIDGVRAGFK